MRRIRSALWAIVIICGLTAGVAIWIHLPLRAQSAWNPTAVENALGGNPPSEWDIVGSGNTPDPDLHGFASAVNPTDPALSVNAGGAIVLKVRTDATQLRVRVYRLGYYGGDGARQIADLGLFNGPLNWTPSGPTPCLRDDNVGLVDCSNWTTLTTWQVPSSAVSGVYIAKLIRSNPQDGRSNHIFFVVRNDASTSDIVFQTSDTTWQAYNYFGGQSLYYGRHTASDCGTYAVPHWENGRSVKVSYHRPFKMTQGVESSCASDAHSYFRSLYGGSSLLNIR